MPPGLPRVAGGYLARSLAKRWWFQKVPYCFSSEWPDRDGHWPPEGRRSGLQGASSASSGPDSLPGSFVGSPSVRVSCGVCATAGPELRSGRERGAERVCTRGRRTHAASQAAGVAACAGPGPRVPRAWRLAWAVRVHLLPAEAGFAVPRGTPSVLPVQGRFRDGFSSAVGNVLSPAAWPMVRASKRLATLRDGHFAGGPAHRSACPVCPQQARP